MPFIVAPIVGALVSAGVSTWIATAVVNLGASFLLGAAARALQGPAEKVRAENRGQELSRPSTSPAYRFVYGEGRATGTPVAYPVVTEEALLGLGGEEERVMFGCWLLNSRVSSLPTARLFLDKREIVVTGDPFDFAGPGATSTEAPFNGGYVRYWISRGDKTSPPQVFLDECPWVAGEHDDRWKATDGWQGRTVLWMRLWSGDAERQQRRWPSKPPAVEVEGRWSRVWDPRVAGQGPNNPASWGWRDNHALCVLDALRTYPVRPYLDANIHLASFMEGADVCDQSVALKSGGTEPRYRAAGTIVFDGSELEDLIGPLVASGAADMIRMGGRLGYAAGA